MASTPPLQIASTPQTPPTPLHGTTYDCRPTRASSRIAARQVRLTPDAPQPSTRPDATVTTPKSSRQSRQRQTAPGIHSPDSTPRNKQTRRVQIISPSSPESETLPSKQMTRSKAHLQPSTSSSTIISDGMLPTPVKTPKKKMVAKANNAARALFQENPDMVDFEPSPRRNRKNKRYNGFSLESFSAEDENHGQIQIFTDSRDRVPQVDHGRSNPFVDHEVNSEASTSQKVEGTSKRRKLSGERKKVDPQVAAAIREDEGMVYVFRGKKVYRRFDDEDDEEEEIEDDLGLLEHSPESTTHSLRTLTRRSIKPKRLFQTETQKKARKAQEEEEALTDIEEPTGQTANADVSSPGSPSIQMGRSLRSSGKALLFTYEAESHDADASSNKKTSPFDTWPRLKSGGRSSSGGQKGRKRGAPDAADDTVGVAAVESKRTRV
ncbi:hypothetical protein G647_02797 [Cladophialophora carrionii CBS 160.54]|uniref:Uncharacterized protein n=1 Tax=Cladophialophora carrionii CBS 160.54 TaxID=1279043 RepID=V9DGP4_9EURO|nr:uncharacterized protein G647_02797 [Cladophialophora carrionii CBS 160.54]ETI26020.1 hypothetical protein G647_02797 [Cladophialophora carrionii CBS 160.54]